MSDWKDDSLRFRPVLTAGLRIEGVRQVLLSPAVGLWRDPPGPGVLIHAGSPVGQLEILGVLHRIVAPAGVRGVVTARTGEHLGRRPVAFSDELVVVDPSGLEGTLDTREAASSSGPHAGTGLQFQAPSSGRFYARPAPDQPAFVEAGDVVEAGRTLGLLEIMKTFHRLTYGGAGLPARARIVRRLVEDGADLDSGEPIFELESADPRADP